MMLSANEKRVMNIAMAPSLPCMLYIVYRTAMAATGNGEAAMVERPFNRRKVPSSG